MELKKVLSIGKKILSSNLSGGATPLSVTHYITYDCNYRCEYCNLWKENAEEMSTDEIKRMIDEFSEAGTERMGFTGGEPLLREDIGEVVSYAKKKGMITTLCTNGELLPKKVDELRDLDLVQISLDGRKETHEKYRTGSNYQNVLKSIDVARENGIEVVTSTVLTKESLKDVEYILDLSEEKNFKPSFMPIYNFSLAGEVEENLPRKEEMKRGVKKILEAKKEGYKVFNSKTLLEHVKENWPDFNNCSICAAARLFCIVDTNGDVCPCQPSQGVICQNGLEVGFKQAFHSLHKPDSGTCWCDSFLELSFAGQLKGETILNILKKL